MSVSRELTQLRDELQDLLTDGSYKMDAHDDYGSVSSNASGLFSGRRNYSSVKSDGQAVQLDDLLDLNFS